MWGKTLKKKRSISCAFFWAMFNHRGCASKYNHLRLRGGRSRVWRDTLDNPHVGGRCSSGKYFFQDLSFQSKLQLSLFSGILFLHVNSAFVHQCF